MKFLGLFFEDEGTFERVNNEFIIDPDDVKCLLLSENGEEHYKRLFNVIDSHSELSELINLPEFQEELEEYLMRWKLHLEQHIDFWIRYPSMKANKNLVPNEDEELI